MKIMIVLAVALAFSAVNFFPVPSARAQDSNPQPKLTQFLNKVSKINHDQEALAGLAISNAGQDAPLKTFANTVKWDDVANQDAVESLAAKENLSLSSNGNIPTPDDKLLHMTGDQFAKAYIADEINDQSNALHAYQNAQNQFKNDPKAELYIAQSLPVVETHLKEAQLLKQHMGELTAAK